MDKVEFVYAVCIGIIVGGVAGLIFGDMACVSRHQRAADIDAYTYIVTGSNGSQVCIEGVTRIRSDGGTTTLHRADGDAVFPNVSFTFVSAGRVDSETAKLYCDVIHGTHTQPSSDIQP